MGYEDEGGAPLAARVRQLEQENDALRHAIAALALVVAPPEDTSGRAFNSLLQKLAAKARRDGLPHAAALLAWLAGTPDRTDPDKHAGSAPTDSGRRSDR